jgi:ectoine hydroxylase-related dioxygenase (phytanoyl-CoA dioxygenase family)
MYSNKKSSSHSAKPKKNRVRAIELRKFSLNEAADAKQFLSENGICIFKNIASNEDCTRLEGRFWDYLEGLNLGMNRNDISTLTDANWMQLGFMRNGILSQFGVGQSDFLWECRLLRNVREMFSAIFETDDLITSFDGCCAFRNPWLNPFREEDWITQNGWFHLDQNSRLIPGFETYQGFLNLLPADAATGGVVVIPRSHEDFDYVCSQSNNQHSNFLPLNDNFISNYQKKPVQIMLDPGDFFLWDSRIIHCSQGATTNYNSIQKYFQPATQTRLNSSTFISRLYQGPIIRLVAYICMLPRPDHNPRNFRLNLERRQIVQNCLTGNHHPIRIEQINVRNKSDLPNLSWYTPPSEDSERWQLV